MGDESCGVVEKRRSRSAKQANDCFLEATEQFLSRGSIATIGSYQQC